MASNLKGVREATQKSFSSSESGHSRPCLLCLRPAPLSAHPHSQPMPLSSRRAPTGSPTSTHLPASVPGAQPSLCVDGLCAPISDEAPRWTLDSHPLAYWARPPRTPHSTINLIFSIESSPPHITSLLLSCIFKNETRDCPGGPVVKNPPANAGHGASVPGPGGSHVPQSNQVSASQLLKPRCLEPVLGNTRSHRSQKFVHATESGPCSPQLEKAPTQQLRLSTAPNKISK